MAILFLLENKRVTVLSIQRKYSRRLSKNQFDEMKGVLDE
jgi:hypothetical protein